MNLLHTFRVFLETSWLKTIRFNLHYFGCSGMLFPVIVSRNIKLRKLKGQVLLGQNRCGRIFLGRNDCIHLTGPGIWANEGTVVFQDKCFLGNGTKISVLPKGFLTLERDVYLTGNSRIICEASIHIKKETIISWDAAIMDSDLHIIYDNQKIQVNSPCPIIIGEHSWIGMGAAVLKGSSLPEGTIVAAKSTVSKEYDEKNMMLGGINQILKKDVYWKA